MSGAGQRPQPHKSSFLILLMGVKNLFRVARFDRRGKQLNTDKFAYKPAPKCPLVRTGLRVALSIATI